MPSAFGKFLDAVADALGLSSDKSRQQTRPRATRPDPPPAAETQPPSQPQPDGGPVLTTFSGLPRQPGGCHACGVGPASPAYENLFCSRECQRRWYDEVEEYREEERRRLSDSMDAWHDQFEERFGEGQSYAEWRAELEERHGKDYLDDIDKRARKKKG